MICKKQTTSKKQDIHFIAYNIYMELKYVYIMQLFSLADVFNDLYILNISNRLSEADDI